MTDNIFVSIIIPIYNAEKYIEKAIISINNQTYIEYEAIFIDDASTDNSIKIIEKYIKNNSRFKLIRLKEKSGVSKARNVGIDEAKGRFLAFLDADDIWKKDKLEKQLKFIKKNNCEFAYGSFKYINNEGTKIGKKIDVEYKVDYKKALLNTKILTTTVIIDLYKIPKEECYMPDIMNEDIATWWSILKKRKNCIWTK